MNILEFIGYELQPTEIKKKINLKTENWQNNSDTNCYARGEYARKFNQSRTIRTGLSINRSLL